MPAMMFAAALFVLTPTANPSCSAFGVECCKTCNKGKACGDSCIARDRKCTKGPGCACDAN